MIRPVSALALALVLALPLAARADPVMITVPSDAFGFTSGQKGLNFGLPSGGGPTIGFSYVLTNRSALELNLGLGATFAGNTDFAFSIEIGYRAYLTRFGDRLYPFIQPTFFFGRQGGAESLAIEGLFGVEYFLLEHFSVSGATGLELAIGNIGGGGSASGKLATGTTALFANFYF
jgi:hypothetical protein